jgi:tRNA 5-methylaminomethyl-2-thiouridine biosynthesis bifunctional protein
MLAESDLDALRAPVTGDGYALRAPPAVGGALIGASYETALPGADPASADGGDEAAIHAGNVARLGRLLPAAPPVQLRTMFDQWRAVSDDRLPLAGALPDEVAMAAGRDRLAGANLADLPRLSGAWGVFGLGSRGLTLAALMAELVAAQIEGEPWPVERDLAASVDPARFALTRLRHGRIR